ncbi:hypothetical protein AAULR_16064, partial [Lacticaseibacillus rhamnosus MTCC 5462]
HARILGEFGEELADLGVQVHMYDQLGSFTRISPIILIRKSTKNI